MPEAQGDQQLLRKAHHEAAHAAVAFRLGIPVDFVTIRPETIDDRACEGFCAFSRRWNHDLASDRGRWLDRFAKAMLAGRVSDELFLAGDVSQEIRGSWWGDSDMMMTRVQELRDFQTWDECEQWRDRMLEETRQILVEPDVQAGIAAIAARLLECGRITGEEARVAFFSRSAENDDL